jgi:hypothetical protein
MSCRNRLAFFAAALLSLFAQAQFFRFDNRSFSMGDGGISRAEIKLSPSAVVVGQQCAFVLEFEVPKNNIVEELRVSGLPQEDAASLEYLSRTFENLSDGATTNKKNVVKRFRLPLIFRKPFKGDLEVSVSGNVGTRTERAGMSMSSFSGFSKNLPVLKLDVRPLPETGKPENFSGAVGNSFAVTANLKPDKVHPGDLVTAFYEVKYDGSFPTNAFPSVSGLSENDFTVYDMKLSETGDGFAKWSQVLVPKTASATNSFDVSVAYYDISKGTYSFAATKTKPLEFISQEAASTENTSVIVSDSKDGNVVSGQNAAMASVGIRFAPNENSPVVKTVSSGVPMKKTGIWGKWIRIETPEAAGWIKKDGNE